MSQQTIVCANPECPRNGVPFLPTRYNQKHCCRKCNNHAYHLRRKLRPDYRAKKKLREKKWRQSEKGKRNRKEQAKKYNKKHRAEKREKLRIWRQQHPDLVQAQNERAYERRKQ